MTINTVALRAMQLLWLGALLSAPALAQERGSAEEARELVTRAIAYYDAQGRDAAFRAFEAADSDFKRKDLYIFVYGPERTIVSHGADPSLVGRPGDSFVDVDGVRFGTMFLDDSVPEGSWMDYKWQDPVSGEVLQKSSWIVRHDAYVFGAGFYKP